MPERGGSPFGAVLSFCVFIGMSPVAFGVRPTPVTYQSDITLIGDLSRAAGRTGPQEPPARDQTQAGIKEDTGVIVPVGGGQDQDGAGQRKFNLDRGGPPSGLLQELGDDRIAAERVVQELVKLGREDRLEAEGDIAEPGGAPALSRQPST
jgi:hypothetical protein